MCSQEDRPETSADQDAWVELNNLIRSKLGQVAGKIPDMTAEDIKHYAHAVQQAQWTAWQAATWDKRLEREMSRQAYDD